MENGIFVTKCHVRILSRKRGRRRECSRPQNVAECCRSQHQEHVGTFYRMDFSSLPAATAEA